MLDGYSCSWLKLVIFFGLASGLHIFSPDPYPFLIYPAPNSRSMKRLDQKTAWEIVLLYFTSNVVWRGHWVMDSLWSHSAILRIDVKLLWCGHEICVTNKWNENTVNIWQNEEDICRIAVLIDALRGWKWYQSASDLQAVLLMPVCRSKLTTRFSLFTPHTCFQIPWTYIVPCGIDVWKISHPMREESGENFSGEILYHGSKVLWNISEQSENNCRRWHSGI